MHITINTSYPQIKIDYQLPQSKIVQEIGNFEYDYQGPSIVIDQQDAMNELGMGTLSYFVQQNTNTAQEKAFLGIARRSREGDRLANEMHLKDTLVRLAIEQSFDQIPEINVDVLPKSRPRIEMNYQLSMRWNQGGPQIDFISYPPQIDFVKGNVEIQVDKGNNLDVRG